MPEIDQTDGKEAEQIQLARDIGTELTEGFVAFVRGRIAFDELSFGVFDALHDLNVIASGDYELEDHGHDHEHDHNHDYDEDEATEEQEDLAQEPARDEPDHTEPRFR